MSGALVGKGMATTAGTGVTLLGSISEINPSFSDFLPNPVKLLRSRPLSTLGTRTNLAASGFMSYLAV
jgi:hypothetical protein